MKSWKRLVSLLLVLAMVATLDGMDALAAELQTSDENQVVTTAESITEDATETVEEIPATELDETETVTQEAANSEDETGEEEEAASDAKTALDNCTAEFLGDYWRFTENTEEGQTHDVNIDSLKYVSGTCGSESGVVVTGTCYECNKTVTGNYSGSHLFELDNGEYSCDSANPSAISYNYETRLFESACALCGSRGTVEGNSPYDPETLKSTWYTYFNKDYVSLETGDFGCRYIVIGGLTDEELEDGVCLLEDYPYDQMFIPSCTLIKGVLYDTVLTKGALANISDSSGYDLQALAIEGAVSLRGDASDLFYGSVIPYLCVGDLSSIEATDMSDFLMCSTVSCWDFSDWSMRYIPEARENMLAGRNVPEDSIVQASGLPLTIVCPEEMADGIRVPLLYIDDDGKSHSAVYTDGSNSYVELSSATNGKTLTYSSYDTATAVTVNYTLGTNAENNAENPSVLGPATVTLKAPTRMGYDFKEWQHNGKKITALPKASAVTDSSYEVTAVWTPKKYTVTLNAAGGKVNGKASTTTTVSYNSAYGTLPVPVKTGYTFTGWYDTEQSDWYEGNKIEGTDLYLAIENTTLYAHWKGTCYHIYLDANGGNDGVFPLGGADDAVDTEAAPYTDGDYSNGYFITMDYGENITLTGNEFYLDGCTISGWSTTENGKGTDAYGNKAKTYANGEISDLTTEEGQIITLYAQWTTTEAKITYVTNGGKLSGSYIKSFTAETADTALPVPTKTGYIFEGWSTHEEDNSLELVDSTGCLQLQDVTLYAYFTPITYYVTLVGADADCPYINTMEYDEEKTIPDLVSEDYFDTLTQKTGYTFTGWSTTQTGKGKDSNGKAAKSYAIDASIKNLATVNEATITLYAQYKANTYKLSYEAIDIENGENVSGFKFKKTSDAPKTFTFGKTTTIRIPAIDGYKLRNFSFYDADEELVMTYIVSEDGSQTVTLTPDEYDTVGGDLKLEMEYQPIMYDVVFHANNPNGITYSSKENLGVYDSSDTMVYYGRTFTLASFTDPSDSEAIGLTEAATDAGISIVGYKIDNKGKTKTYGLYDSISNLTTTEGDMVDLYAVWGTQQYGITYDLQGGSLSKAPAYYSYNANKTTALTNPTRTGYTFAGWANTEGRGDSLSSLTKDSKGKYTINKGARGNLYLTATWTPVTYKVTITGNKYTTGAAQTLTVTYDGSEKEGCVATATNQITAKGGYTLTGYNTSSNGKGIAVVIEDDGTMDLTGLSTGKAVTLYAQTSVITYHCVQYAFDADTGSAINLDDHSFTTDTTYQTGKQTTLKAPVYEGYTLKNSSLADGAISSAKVVSKNGNVTAIAKDSYGDMEVNYYYTRDTFQLAYNANGGSMCDYENDYTTTKNGSVTIKIDDSTAIDYWTTDLTEENFENAGSAWREGYRLDGWALDKKGKNLVYASDDDGVTLNGSVLKAKNGKTVTLYAVWTKVSTQPDVTAVSLNQCGCDLVVKPTLKGSNTADYMCVEISTSVKMTDAQTYYCDSDNGEAIITLPDELQGKLIYVRVYMEGVDSTGKTYTGKSKTAGIKLETWGE